MIDLDRTESYDLKDIASGISFYYDVIKRVNPSFFALSQSDNLPYTPREIEATLALASRIKPKYLIILTHPLIESALTGVEFYERKLEQESQNIDQRICTVIYSDIITLVGAAIQIILSVMRNDTEESIINLPASEVVNKLTRNRQELKYNTYYPKNVIEQLREYYNSRIEDFKEILSLDQLDYSSELKELIKSYNRGLKINIKGKNLNEPLLRSEFSVFVERLKELLFIPSYFDITEIDKERIFHIYLLGVLEGRLMFYNLSSNRESGIGRYDICGSPLNNTNPGLIIEIKTSGKNLTKIKIEAELNNALEQIDKNQYFLQLKREGVTSILTVAILFQKKQPYVMNRIITL